MKKFVLLVVAMVTLSNSSSYAADLTVGATGWYSLWEIKDSDATIDPGILYGPALAITFNQDFNLNFVFLYGTYDAQQDDGFGGKMSYQYKRYDSDSSIGYKINSYLKFFAGLKYNAYTTEISIMGNDVDLKVQMYGPAAGLSAVMPLGNDFFILANGSGIYLFNKQTSTGTPVIKTKGYGYNTSAAIAYYIAPASVTLSIGGRYQYIQMESDDSSSEDSKMNFYGVTASATYSFSL